MPWGFTHSFNEADRESLIEAQLDVRFDISRGEARLDKWGCMNITLESRGGYRHHCVDYQELRRQLRFPESVQLYKR